MAITQPTYPIAVSDLVDHVGAYADEGADLGIDWMEIGGHSIAAGGGSRIAPIGGYTYLLKQALGIKRSHDLAVGGAIGCRPTANATGDGGYAWVLRNLARPGQTGVTATPGTPYSPMSQLVLLHIGLNDLGELGAAKPLPFQTALRTMMAGYCSSAFFAYNHASWAYTGAGWTALSITDVQASSSDLVGVNYNVTVANAPVATWTVPADVPDGRVMQARLWVNAAWAQLTYGVRVRQGGVWTALPDLVLTPANMTDQGVANMHVVHTLRFGSGVANDPYGAINLKAGDAIELSLKAGPGIAIDGAAVECDPAGGPRFIMPLPHKPASYSIWSGWPGGASMNDAVIDQWKDYERAILAEFPGRVFTDPVNGLLGIDLDNAGLNRYTVASGPNPAPAGVTPDQINDGAHPTDAGHGKLAAYVASAVRGSPLITDAFRTRPFVDPKPRGWRKVGAFNGAGAFPSGWSNYGNAAFPDFQWRMDENRRVFVRASLKAATGAAGTLLAANSLPKPAVQVSGKFASGYTGTAWDTAWKGLRAQNTGSLTIVGSAVSVAAGNLLEFEFDYQAEL